MKDIGIAIIGHGFMGHEHEKMLLNFPGIKLIGFADIDPKQLEDVTEGLKRYASNEELMADPEVDVVLIAANNRFHKELVIQAANAKKDIICEKPIAMSLEELDEMEAAVKANGVKFTVHHQRRKQLSRPTALSSPFTISAVSTPTSAQRRLSMIPELWEISTASRACSTASTATCTTGTSS